MAKFCLSHKRNGILFVRGRFSVSKTVFGFSKSVLRYVLYSEQSQSILFSGDSVQQCDVCSAMLMLHIQYDHFYKTNRDLQGDYITSRV